MSFLYELFIFWTNNAISVSHNTIFFDRIRQFHRYSDIMEKTRSVECQAEFALIQHHTWRFYIHEIAVSLGCFTRRDFSAQQMTFSLKVTIDHGVSESSWPIRFDLGTITFPRSWESDLAFLQPCSGRITRKAIFFPNRIPRFWGHFTMH